MKNKFFKYIIQKINGLGLKVTNKLKLNYIPFLPTHLDIEPINSCNFKCEHCKVSYWNKKSESLSLDNFIKIISQFPNLKSIKLQGLGEPLLNKDFPEMIRTGAENKITMEFFSNGSVYLEKTWSEINKFNNVHILFSIDAATEEKFEKIRKGSNFNKVIRNIEKIILNNEDKYAFWTVVNAENIYELPKIIELANKLKVKKVSFQTFLSDWKSDEVNDHIKTISYNIQSENYNKNELLAKSKSKEHGINLEIYNGNFLTQKNKCSWPFTRAFIASNGDVVPCCVISDSDVIKMGNVFEKPFKEIWNSTEYKDFRKTIKNHQLHDFCKSCYGEL